MHTSYKPFSEIQYLSSRDVAYQLADERLEEFYKYPVNLESFEQVIKNKQTQNVDRTTLIEVIKDQYKIFNLSETQVMNIDLLARENTYTIVTAHQPSLLTGPLYYIYKIASTINLCQRLKEHYPENHFVPVFINGSEDHDFEEINHVNLFHKTIHWEEEKRGPVGRLPVGQLETVIQEVGEILGSSTFADEVRSLLKESLAKSKTYNDFAAHLVQFLFAPYGVISLNTDDQRLKKAFVPIIKKEIFSSFSISHIEKAQAALEEKGFKGQAYPRDINFFYLGDGYRERIEKEGGTFKVLNTDIVFTADALEKEIEEHPDRFSPNVIMRPLYQELILPNLAYIGGGGELAYWLERRSQFEEAGIPFPMLIRRNSVMLLAPGHQKSMDKLEIARDEIWQEEYMLVNKILENASDVDLNVDTEYEAISEAMEAISKRALAIDPGLEKYVLAERVKTLKNIDQIGSRLKRAVKSQEENKVKQVKNLKEKLFPNGGLQERHNNFFQYYITYGRPLLDYLVQELDPLNKDFVIIEL